MKLFKVTLLFGIIILIISCGTKTGPTPPPPLDLRELLKKGWTEYGKHNIDKAYANFDTLVSQVRADTGDGYIGLAYAARDLGSYSESHASDALALSLLNDPIVRVLNERALIVDSSYTIYLRNPIGFLPDTALECEVGIEDGRGVPVGSRLKYVIVKIDGNSMTLKADFTPAGPPRAQDKIFVTYYTYDTTKTINGLHLLAYANEVATYYAEGSYWEASGMFRNFEILLDKWGNSFEFSSIYPNLIVDQSALSQLDLMINEYNVKLLAAFSYFNKGMYANSIFIVRNLINDSNWNDPDNPDVQALFEKLLELSN